MKKTPKESVAEKRRSEQGSQKPREVRKGLKSGAFESLSEKSEGACPR